MKEFYEPMLYLSTPDHPNTMGVIAELKEPIDGEILNSYPDGDDHSIDAVRYATESIWRRKGQ